MTHPPPPPAPAGALPSDEVLRALTQAEVRGNTASSERLAGGIEDLVRDLAQALLDARAVLRGLVEGIDRHIETTECYMVGGPDGEDALRKAKALLPKGAG